MPCIVCGDPKTIEAHIFPRALYRMAAGKQQHAYEGSAHREGTKFQAKGLFDPNLLCRLHEDAFRQADDYGVRFIRTFQRKGKVALDGRAWMMPNPNPKLLVRFVAGCIWRRSVSPIQRDAADLDLGTAEPRFRDFLFNPASTFNPPMFVKRRTLMSQEHHLHEVMWLPTKGFGGSKGAWSFFAFGCEFVMNVSPYGGLPIHALFRANDKKDLWCVNSPPEQFTGVAGVLDIAVNMYRSKYEAEKKEERRTPKK